MDELLAEVKTGKIKEPLAMGLEWDMGCGESGAEHNINTKVSERQCYICGHGQGEPSCKSNEQATGGRAGFHGAASWQTG